jgi:putative hydrolase of HD superfamily
MKKGLVDSLLIIGKLKTLKRTGWVREGMPDPESVAEHTFRVCLLVVFLGEELKVSVDKLLKMAVLHDIEEAVTEDPVTQRGAEDVDDHDHESEKHIIRDLVSETSAPQELYQLWREHLKKNAKESSREADVLYQLGKIATVWQALEYELGGADPKKLDEFWENARRHIKKQLFVKLLDSLEKRRK